MPVGRKAPSPMDRSVEGAPPGEQAMVDVTAGRGTFGDQTSGSHENRRPLAQMWPAYTAAALAFVSAAVSVYWTLGGTALLDTLGGTFERLARDRSEAALALGIAVILVKVAGGMLALALVRPWGARIGRRWLLVSGVAGSLVLVLYGERRSWQVDSSSPT
jgi:Protein of unknown function (DUF3995)